jgi:hypothetical protein
MADTVHLDAEASPFSATEQKCFNALWAEAPVHDGYLPGAAAVKFLSASKLPKTVLRKIWYVCVKSPHRSTLAACMAYASPTLVK